MKRLNAIASAGYDLIVGYSCQWQQLKQTSHLAQYVVNNQMIGPPIKDNGMTEQELLDRIQNGEMDGYLLASAVVPTHLRDFFSDLPPLFKRVEISRSDLSPIMLKYCEKHDLLKSPSKQLVTGFHMENAMYYSHYVRYLLDHGVHFFNVRRMYQYRTSPILRSFLMDAANQRMKAQADGNDIKSNNLKLLCNSVSFISKRSHYFVLYFICNVSGLWCHVEERT